MSDRLFAYGTLLPGQQRWQYLAPLVVDEGLPADVHGALFDTGFGYPAAVFGIDGRVAGRVFRFLTGRAEAALEVIDEVERVADELYRRVRVEVEGHGAVWAYEYIGVQHFARIDGGSWVEHVRRAG